MKALYKRIEEESSLTWMEYLVISPTQRKESSVTLTDMLDCDLDMALKIKEYIDITDSVMELEYDEAQKQMEQASTLKRGR